MHSDNVALLKRISTDQIIEAARALIDYRGTVDGFAHRLLELQAAFWAHDRIPSTEP